MTATNPRPWRDRITVDDDGRYCTVDGGEFHRLPNATLRSLLDEAHALAAEVDRLRTLLAAPADGPLRVVRMDGKSFDELHSGDEFLCVIVDPAEAAAIEAQLAAPGNVHPDLVDGTVLIRRWLAGGAVDAPALTAEMRQWVDTFDPPPHDLPDGVQSWTAAPIEIDGVPVVGVAMGDVVRGLPDDEWLLSSDAGWWHSGPNAGASDGLVYLLGRKPQPEPTPTVTVELPQDLVEAMCDEVDIDYHTVAAACRKALGR